MLTVLVRVGEPGTGGWEHAVCLLGTVLHCAALCWGPSARAARQGETVVGCAIPPGSAGSTHLQGGLEYNFST